jgi:hypothetical protein
VLVANRLPAELPVIDQVEAAAAAACQLLAVEVRPPGHALRLLADPVALGARLGLGEDEAGDAVSACRGLTDYANAVVGLLPAPSRAPVAPGSGEPWVMTPDGGRLPLRTACAQLPGWPAGAVRAFGIGSGPSEVDDLFAVDLAAAAEAATARQGSTGRAVLVASLSRLRDPQAAQETGMLAVDGPGGLLPFDRHHGPGEWRAIRLRLKSAVLASNFRRAVRTLGQDPSQVLVVGGPAGDEELLGVIARSLPDGVAVGRGNVGGTCPGEPLGHRYAVALGLALTRLAS